LGSGINILVGKKTWREGATTATAQCLLLLNLVRHHFDRHIISVVWITRTFSLPCTDLSDALRDPEGPAIVLANSDVADHDGGGIQIQLTVRRIIITK
jgi:hypothetical protein